MQAPIEIIRDRRESLLEHAQSLLELDTQNPPGNTTEAVTYLESQFSHLGIATERSVVDPTKPNLLARIPGERPQTLLYSSHLDTVPFNREDWKYDPLGERRESNGETRLYGRGATDMKGAVAAVVETARAFVKSDQSPPISLLFAFVSDEEVSGEAGLPALVDQIDADGCVVGETTCSERCSVTVADRGSIWLTLEADGVSAHGSRPSLGVNAIDRLYEAIETIREQFGSKPLTLDDPVRSIIEESVEHYGPTFGETTARNLFEFPSINLGRFEGGSAINAVPETASAEIDIRLSPGVPTPAVIDEIRSCIDACDGIRIADLSWSIGTYEHPGEPIVEATVEAADTRCDERIYRRCATGGGNAKTLRNAGIPTVEFAHGTNTAHAADEYTTAGALLATAETYVRLPAEFAKRI